MAERAQTAFRFGVGPGGLRPVDSTTWKDLARQAETLGYSTLSVSDHIMHYGPFAAMAVAASVTTTLRVGTLVLCNDFYHPAVIAREAVTLDALSDGRMELGVGAGWMQADYDSMSIGFDAPVVRIDRLREAVRIIRALTAGEECSFDGEFHRIKGLRLDMRRNGSPPIPVLIAGSGSRMLRFAAEHADVVGVNVTLAGGVWSDDVWKSATTQSTDAKVRLLDECDAARPVAAERQVVSHHTAITQDRDSVLESLASSWKMSVTDVARSPHVLVGSVAQVVDQLIENRGRYGFSYITVAATALEEFAPVVSELAGR